MQSLYQRLLFPLALVVSLGVLGLCAYLAQLTPQNRWPYLVAAGLVVVAWIVRYAAGIDSDPKAAMKQIRITQAIVSAGLLLAFALIAKLADHLR